MKTHFRSGMSGDRGGNIRLLWLVFLAAFITRAAAGSDWHPAAGPSMTRWAADVNPTNAHPEYPRPQLVRPDWLNLNGLWNYAVTPNADSAPTNFNGQILVPFPIESALSGVMRRFDEHSTLWYQRQFIVPADWAGRRVRLHFGAVDWQVQVFVNCHDIGVHRGGYDGFSFDITDDLRWRGAEEITVAVTDPTEGDQSRGKQSRNPEGIFYMPSSGIWQTVWLEPVSKTCVDDLRLTPDIGAKVLKVQVDCGNGADSLRAEAVAYADGKEVGRVTGPANQEFDLPVSELHLWSPDTPYLYDLKITLKDGDRALDTVTSYFGMRKIALGKDDAGVTRIMLNNQFIFEMGTLDQGYWPDGIYTAPTDDALRFDIEFLKRAGFNLTRKHVKVEPDRWYYWCDKLGLLVWQDMPSGNNTTRESRTQFEQELQRLVAGRFNHPSIVVWVLFNESWGQYETERLVPWLKLLDPSRLVDNASGWTDKHVGDLVDFHSYPGPDSPHPEPERAAVLGEFGGLGLGLPGHTWSKQFWGYQPMPDATVLRDRFAKLMDRVNILRGSIGLSAAIYTQTTDVETECNGLLTYDRAIAKMDPAVIRAANHTRNPSRRFQVIAPNALYARVNWKFTTHAPPPDWMKPEFNDTNWNSGIGGFGTEPTPSVVIGTTWDSADIWMRREFSITGTEDLSKAVLQLHHDEDTEIYFNGVLASQMASFSMNYFETNINSAAISALKPGVNEIAVHCHQTTGGQYIDVGIVIPLPDSEGK